MKQNRVERIICFLGEYSQTVCTTETGRAIAEHTSHHLGAHASCARTTTICIVYYKFRGSLVTQTIRPSETFNILGNIDFANVARHLRPIPTERLSWGYQSLGLIDRTRQVAKLSLIQQIPHPKSPMPPFYLPLSGPLLGVRVQAYNFLLWRADGESY